MATARSLSRDMQAVSAGNAILSLAAMLRKDSASLSRSRPIDPYVFLFGGLPTVYSSSIDHCKTLFDTDRRVFNFIKTDGSLIDPVPFIDKFHSDMFFEYDFDGYQTIGQYIYCIIRKKSDTVKQTPFES